MTDGYVFASLLLIVIAICMICEYHKTVLRLKVEASKCNELEFRIKNNQYLKMSATEFDDYLSWVFACYLEHRSFEKSSPLDPDSTKDLIASATISICAHFGDCMDLIELAYGKNFIQTWVSLKLYMLFDRDAIKKFLVHELSVDAIYDIIRIRTKKK